MTKRDPNASSQHYDLVERMTATNGGTASNKVVLDQISSRTVGQKVKGWRRVVAQGGNATSPLGGTKVWGKPTPYTVVSGIPNGTVYTTKGYISYTPGIGDTTPMTKVTSRASSAFQAKAAEAMRTFDTPSFFGEIAETIRMIRHPFKAITDLSGRYVKNASRIAKYGKGGRKGRNKAIYELYLQYVYGVKPLLNDIDSLTKTLAERKTEIKVKRISAEYNETSKVDEVTVTPFAWGHSYGDVRCKGATTVTHSCRITGAVRVKSVSENGAEAYAEGFGLGLDQFIPSVYNLIPYSFIVDYFTNVGEVIEGLTNYRASYSWSCTSYRVEASFVGSVKNVGQLSGNQFVRIEGGTHESHTVSFSRSIGIPPITLESLYFKMPNLKQILNMSALIGVLTAKTR